MAERKTKDFAQTMRGVVDATIARSESDDPEFDGELVIEFPPPYASPQGAVFPPGRRTMIGKVQGSPSSRDTQTV